MTPNHTVSLSLPLPHLYKTLFDRAGVNYSHFVRTTAAEHEAAVQAFWRRLEAGGHIYKGEYAGYYSVEDESFVPETNIADGTDRAGRPCKINTESGQPVEFMREENFFFALGAHAPQLEAWLTSAPDTIVPAFRGDEVLAAVRGGLPDLSISRPASSNPWAVPVPGHPEHTIYVWLDALVNYLTVGGYPDREIRTDYNIVGKDIIKCVVLSLFYFVFQFLNVTAPQTRFHAIIWPALLMAAGLEPPRRIIAHGHWLCEGHKVGVVGRGQRWGRLPHVCA